MIEEIGNKMTPFDHRIYDDLLILNFTVIQKFLDTKIHSMVSLISFPLK